MEDFGSLTGPRTIEIKRLLPGPMERIWDYLTKSELRKQWLASGDMELKVGAEFTLTWRNDELATELGDRPEGKSSEHTAQMRVTECDPPRKLAYVFGNAGEVSFTLAPAGDKVLLTLIHSNAPDRGTMLGVSAGWHAHLDVLAAVLSGTKGKPFWETWAALKPIYDKNIPAD
jgi:uncharacterized protein YndB with AHSA1/START domain